MEIKYRGLRIIGLLLKIIGVLELLFGIFCAIVLPLALSDANVAKAQSGFLDYFPGSGLLFGGISGIIIFLVGLVCGLLTFSLGELFTVVIAIEANTRETVLLLHKKD